MDDLLDVSMRAKKAAAEKEAAEARLEAANASLETKEQALVEARKRANTLSE